MNFRPNHYYSSDPGDSPNLTKIAELHRQTTEYIGKLRVTCCCFMLSLTRLLAKQGRPKEFASTDGVLECKCYMNGTIMVKQP
jgi:hypothetical protein